MTDADAESKLATAREHFDRAAVASHEPEDREAFVVWVFYAYEVAVVAAAEKAGISWSTNHPSKQDAARELHSAGHVAVDVSEKLDELNDLRKDVSYGEPGPELSELSLEDMLVELEEFIESVAKLIRGDST